MVSFLTVGFYGRENAKCTKSFLEYGAAVLETHSVCNKREMAFVFTAILEYGAAVLEVDSVYNEREREREREMTFVFTP